MSRAQMISRRGWGWVLPQRPDPNPFPRMRLLLRLHALLLLALAKVYLRDHPPASAQYRSPRRQKLSGVIGLHTTEGVLDGQGADMGAENTAAYISRRDTPGSYHDIVDSDSIVQVVDYDDEAFHIATHLLNRRTTGLAFACRTIDWARMTPRVRAAFLDNGAQAAARQARHHHARTGIVIPARRISLAQALAGHHGFLAHGDADPARRTDPGIKPEALFPFDDFLARYRRHAADLLGGAQPPSPDTGDLTVTEAERLQKQIDDAANGNKVGFEALGKRLDALEKAHADGAAGDRRTLAWVKGKLAALTPKKG